MPGHNLSVVLIGSGTSRKLDLDSTRSSFDRSEEVLWARAKRRGMSNYNILVQVQGQGQGRQASLYLMVEPLLVWVRSFSTLQYGTQP